MPGYALDELPTLISRLRAPLDDADPVLRYICALFAELPYYHVPAYELDGDDRAKIIPSAAWKELIRRGKATDVLPFLESPGFSGRLEIGENRVFSVHDRGAIAVGVVIRDVIWVGFRGTVFLYDWGINANVQLVERGPRLLHYGPYGACFAGGRLHGGFAEEALRISVKVARAIHDLKLKQIERIVFTGHSLGGAIAAISRDYVQVAPSTTCIFGSPRYCDREAYSPFLLEPPVHVRRPGDIVPTLPPRALGYVDHPYEFTTDGRTFLDTARSSLARDLWRWARFLSQRFTPHDMADYRAELGYPAGAMSASEPLAAFERFG